MSPSNGNWRSRYADILVSPEEAVQAVADGDVVWLGGWTSMPLQLADALAGRAAELQDVTILNFLAPYNWDRPAVVDRFRVVTYYASPFDRSAIREGRIEFVPVAQFRHGQLPPGMDRHIDIAMVPISPPDDDGWCSFGASLFYNPQICSRVPRLIGEVHPEFIRTGGENRVHISRFERIAEYTRPVTSLSVPPRSPETESAAQVICALVASEIVYDGATVQFGIGDVSAALPAFLEHRRDLGIHTELLPGGIPELVELGVVTGTHKAVNPGKIVASSIAQVPQSDLAYMDNNPAFEFYDFTYTDDLRILLQFENFVAVNNALAVDVTGNVSSESIGPRVFSGVGGQNAFAVAASHAAGGSVIVLPSVVQVGAERKSRIVAGHEPGTTLSVHRGFVDFVVTEHGIASLRGKSLRERMDELIAIAHPDFRAELRADGQRLHGG
jgi:acyl-CoA hydrolase